MNISKKNDRIIKSILVFAAIIVVIGMSYAYITFNVTGTKQYVLSSTGLKLYLDESKTLTDVVGENVVPVADYQGMQNDSYVFSIVNDNVTKIDYGVYLVLNSDNTMPSTAMRYNLASDNLDLNKTGNIDDVTDEVGKLLYNGTLHEKSKVEFDLKLWLGKNAGNECKNKKFSAKVVVEAVQNINNLYVDASGANQPIISTGMIPVTYDGENWVKADMTKEWYNYDEQWWANAVTVSNDTRQTYMDADEGTPISMSDINTMWVWIPRYEYETITSTTATEIKVNFLNGTESNKTTNYNTHQAFEFGSKSLTGIWVAKFEASSDSECTPTGGNVDKGCDLTSLKINVKPNITAWRGIRPSTIDLNTRAMNASGNIYGLAEEEVDTHAMKNLEWGAVAYLSQSKYGKYGNSSYEDANKEIYQNKSEQYITGMSNGTPSSSTVNTQIEYNVEGTGTGASTTGNIYGVYDMSGGSNEYVMGVIKDNLNNNPMSGKDTTFNSGFSGKIYNSESYDDFIGRSWPSNKYYDLYDFGLTSEDDDAYSRYKLGDATTETKKWYNDSPSFVNSNYPWFMRGGTKDDYSVGGIFYFYRAGAGASDYTSFRPVLIQK